jgi:hypothetical protein
VCCGKGAIGVTGLEFIETGPSKLEHRDSIAMIIS